MTKHLLGILFLFFFFFDKRNNQVLSWGLKPSEHWWERQKRRPIRGEGQKEMTAILVSNAARAKLDLFLCFCVSGLLFPLNLTVGVWSITEKYLTTKNRWSEMNLCWLDPGRSPGTYLKLDLGENKCTKKKPRKNMFSKKEFVTKK